MTKSEYRELVEFIAPRFDLIDERLRRVEILGEENRHQIQIVADAVSQTVSDDKFEAFRSEVAACFQNVHDLLRTSHLGARPTGDAPGARP
jgi:ribosome maturation factor RimP